MIFGQPVQVGQPTIQMGPPINAPGGIDPFQTNGSFSTTAPGFIQPNTGTGVNFQNPPMLQQAPPYIYPAPNSQPLLGPGVSVPPTVPNGTGSFGNTAVNQWPGQVWSRLQQVQWQRLFERPRFRASYLMGSPTATDGNELSIVDVELATTVNFPNFVYCGLPLRMSPGFIFHYWEGPNTIDTGFELPPRAYSAYLAFDFITRLDRQIGAELNFTIGVYTDFSHVTSDSIRLTGVGLGWFRLSNSATFKIGVEYLDRVKTKLLPAFGLFLMPSNYTKIDIYFPRPRIAARIPNVGNYEVWGYLGAEYGAGSWTVEFSSGFGDQVDINDIRVFLGAEWLGPRNVSGFAEIGYVFDRDLVYRARIPSNLKLEDTIMFRVGVAF
jgi:hypothetical protein